MSKSVSVRVAGFATVVLLAGCSGSGLTSGPTVGSAPAASSSSLLTAARSSALTDTSSSALSRNPASLAARELAAGVVRGSVTPFVNVARIDADKGTTTFISNAGTATVSVWGSDGQLDAILFDGISANPTGLTTDSGANLYVVNTSLGNIIVYPKPYTAIKRTLIDAGEITNDVAVDSTGLVGVTNYLTTGYLAGSVNFFAKGATQPCARVQDPNWIYFFDDAFDASGNLFLDGEDANGHVLVGEISGGCKATSITTLTVGNIITSPGGVAVNRGNILIGDVDAQAIDTYAAPSGGSLGTPVITQLAGATAPVAFAIEANGKRVRTADLSSYTEWAPLYTYPAGEYKSKLADHVYAIGVAVYPPAKP